MISKKLAQKSKSFLASLVLLSLGTSFLNIPIAQAAVIIDNQSFEKAIEQSWSIWKNPDSPRSYELYRSYEAPFGHGSYSAAIEAAGSPDARFSAFLNTKVEKAFTIEAGKAYYLSFQAKGNAETKISLFVERSDTYQAVSEISEVNIGTTWGKHLVKFTPNYSGPALLAIAYGDMPENSTIYLDGFNIFENNFTLTTTEVKGYIGDQEKTLATPNLYKYFTKEEVSVELPYSDNTDGQIKTKRFTPTSLTSSGLKFRISEQTFSGIGHLYVGEALIGDFSYIVIPKITEISPVILRSDEDITVYGSGFSPLTDNTFIIVSVTDNRGKKYENWLKPHLIESSLTQIVAKVPAGIVPGRLDVRTPFTNAKGETIIQKSNAISYEVKPVVFNAEWTAKGYDQVGDTMVITGKGIASSPKVIFYSEEGEKNGEVIAKVKEINTEENYEKIEFNTDKKQTIGQITVKIGQVESDMSQALTYTAKPKLTAAKTAKTRSLPSTSAKIIAAKVGETIKLSGEAFKPQGEGKALVVFQTLIGESEIEASALSSNGTYMEAVVPSGAQNGRLKVKINGQTSNSLDLEIIPTIIATYPTEIYPGEQVRVIADGAGLEAALAEVIFEGINKQQLKVPAETITAEGERVSVNIKAPNNLPNNYQIKLRYGNWTNDEAFTLVTRPAVTSASIDLDSKTLTITGHGFAAKQQDNVITYMYADHTVITPQVKYLGISETGEGQQMKIQLLDGYYYGYVKVTVAGHESNEADFGPTMVRRIEKRTQYVKTLDRIMGVVYISGINMGAEGDVKVGDVWAETHYRSNTFIIAVVEKEDLYKTPVIVTKK
jgi:hypothetical protein